MSNMIKSLVVCTLMMSLFVTQANAQEKVRGVYDKCFGMSEGSQCWIELSNKPECYIWTAYYTSDDEGKFSWSGSCVDGLAIGNGTMKVRGDGRYSGRISDRGTREGVWKYRTTGGIRKWSSGFSTDPMPYHSWEGEYRNSKRHGSWTMSHDNGGTLTAFYLDNEPEDSWEMTQLYDQSGNLRVNGIGEYRDGRRDGYWMLRKHYPNGKEILCMESDCDNGYCDFAVC